jgi:hypothetical protein
LTNPDNFNPCKTFKIRLRRCFTNGTVAVPSPAIDNRSDIAALGKLLASDKAGHDYSIEGSPHGGKNDIRRLDAVEGKDKPMQLQSIYNYASPRRAAGFL